jgi:hypothetical protein
LRPCSVESVTNTVGILQTDVVGSYCTAVVGSFCMNSKQYKHVVLRT